MVLLYLTPPKWLQCHTLPGFCPRLSQDVFPYAKTNALGWVGGKRVASLEIQSFKIEWLLRRKGSHNPPCALCCVCCTLSSRKCEAVLTIPKAGPPILKDEGKNRLAK